MDIYELDRDEAIILQAANVSRDGYDESEFEDEELHELVLTNKNLIYIVSDIDSEDEDAIKVPLDAINVIGGKAQAKEMIHELYGRCLQVQFKHGIEYWRFGRKGKTAIPQWIDALTGAIMCAPAHSTTTNTSAKPNRKQNTFTEDVVDKPTEHKTVYCSSCGAALNNGSKFCHECGAAVSTEKTKTSKRETVYEGNLHKCPSCGEIIKSFETNCPACGHEFRETKASGVVKEFERKLEEIEKTRPHNTPKRKRSANSETEVSATDQKIITLIRNFPIPNTKEDLLEFLVLAASNINLKRYDEYDSNAITSTEKAVSDAWKAKFDQAYEKAKLSFGREPEFKRIQELYANKQKEIVHTTSSSRKRTVLTILGTFALLIAINGVIWGTVFFENHSASKKIEKENERLELIVEDVYAALENGNYVLARAKAASLTFSGPDTNEADIAQEKWDTTRAELLDIINKAEYGADYVTPNANNTSNNSISEPLQFAYLNSEWDLYVAIEQNDGLIKIEKWRKGSSSDIKFDYDYDVGFFNVNDTACGFSWIDDEKMAFTITLKDSNNLRLTKETQVVFIVNNDGSKFTGTHFSDDIACYAFQNDDWDMYRAILINETAMKIEVWDRGSSDSPFEYERDLCVFNLNDPQYDLQWSSDTHTAFSITLKDSKNLYWGKEQRIVFTLENANYTSKDLYAHYYGED